MGKNSGRNINFRETKSERSATGSYRNFHRNLKNIYTAIRFKFKKDKNKYES